MHLQGPKDELLAARHGSEVCVSSNRKGIQKKKRKTEIPLFRLAVLAMQQALQALGEASCDGS